jgi:lactate dehydrogenase-like 2-hydroxyacid dehydrogenase
MTTTTRRKVLFCGHEFADGFEYARKHAASLPHVDVDRCERAETSTRIETCEVAVPLMTKLDADIIARGARDGRLRLVLQFGVGLEGVDVDAATRCGVRVARIPSEKTGNATSTAEMAVYLLLAALRSHDGMSRSVETRRLGTPTGRTLGECAVLVVGWGHIGVKIAKLLEAFGCETYAARRGEWSRDASDRDGVRLAGVCSTSASSTNDYDEILGRVDAVCLACTQDASNMGMIDAKFLSKMKPGSVLVNVARGGLFNRDDVLDALNSGHLGYLATDVAWSEPVDPDDAVVRHPNSYFTPHVGGVCHGSYNAMGEIIANCTSVLDKLDELPPGTYDEWNIQIVN